MSKEDGKDCRKYFDCKLKAPCVGCDDYEGCDNVKSHDELVKEAVGEMREKIAIHKGEVHGITDTQELIRVECGLIQDILLEKNRKYGDSAINPCRIFSKADPLEQINVRLDDKLSRLESGQEDEDEDVELDIIGYLI